MTVPTPTLPQLLEQNLVRNTLVASGTVLVYDFLCTFDQEVAYAWSNPRTISSFLFFINRYLPFVDTFMALRLKFSQNTPEECLEQYTVVTWFIVLGTIFSEAILFLRTYAIWERKRVILVSLVLLAIIVLPVSLTVAYLEIQSLVYVPSWEGGCLLLKARPLINVAYIMLVICETTMAVLTVIRAYHLFREPQTTWIIQLHKDGLIFYAFLLPLSLANIIVPVTAPSMFANWLATPQRVIHSILCTRVLFLILRQRSATTLTNRLPGSGNTLRLHPVFASVPDEEQTTTSMQIIMATELRDLEESESRV
ncbi:hypothetical protein H2248_001861 [Termitomyces sp. 'cryptogamus']|nr:hypothetical protein H2248_001861 [Termitomyces sp. 'cryptogamus']